MFNETKISPIIFNFTKTCMLIQPTLLWSLKLFLPSFLGSLICMQMSGQFTKWTDISVTSVVEFCGRESTVGCANKDLE